MRRVLPPSVGDSTSQRESSTGVLLPMVAVLPPAWGLYLPERVFNLSAWGFFFLGKGSASKYGGKNLARNTRLLIGTNFRVALGTHSPFAGDYMMDVHVVLAEHPHFKRTRFQ